MKRGLAHWSAYVFGLIWDESITRNRIARVFSTEQNMGHRHLFVISTSPRASAAD
jgi:hypothetical protein